MPQLTGTLRPWSSVTLLERIGLFFGGVYRKIDDKTARKAIAVFERWLPENVVYFRVLAEKGIRWEYLVGKSPSSSWPVVFTYMLGPKGERELFYKAQVSLVEDTVMGVCRWTLSEEMIKPRVSPGKSHKSSDGLPPN